MSVQKRESVELIKTVAKLLNCLFVSRACKGITMSHCLNSQQSISQQPLDHL